MKDPKPWGSWGSSQKLYSSYWVADSYLFLTFLDSKCWLFLRPPTFSFCLTIDPRQVSSPISMPSYSMLSQEIKLQKPSVLCLSSSDSRFMAKSWPKFRTWGADQVGRAWPPLASSFLWIWCFHGGLRWHSKFRLKAFCLRSLAGTIKGSELALGPALVDRT